MNLTNQIKAFLFYFMVFRRFFLAEKSVGAKGFKATWTEIKVGAGCSSQPDMFQCQFSKFCIPIELTCNGMHNCGQDDHGNRDQSDEQACKLTCINFLVIFYSLHFTSAK